VAILADYKNQFIKNILEIEIENWNNAKIENRDEVSLDWFTTVRSSMFNTWSIGALESYYEDLCNYKRDKINIMALKYARAGNLIPLISDNWLIDEVVKIETKWQQEVRNKYPNIIRDNSEVFLKYLIGELESYSYETLRLCFYDIMEAKENNVNLAEERYKMQFSELGYSSLKEADEAARGKIV
jgi:hypothetical protein